MRFPCLSISGLSFAALIAAALAIPVAHAQYSQQYNDCMARTHGATVQQGMCAQAELTKQDDRLNKAYQQVMGQFPQGAPQRIQLRDEERSWLKKRDYDCKLNGDTIDNGCLLDKTKARADELEKRIHY